MFIQREVGPYLVVIRSVSLQDTTQVRLAEHDYLIEAFATYRSDECCREAADTEAIRDSLAQPTSPDTRS